MTQYWILKSEASCYSIDDFKKNKKTTWSGIRNYQARNFMKSMNVGDLCLFYHSSSEPTGVFGIAKVIKKAHPDVTALDPKDDHYDPKASKENPIWENVDIQFVKKFNREVTLDEIKRDPKLSGIALAQRGSRLSVMPVSEQHFNIIDTLGSQAE